MLAHPYVRVWAVRCLEQLSPASDRPAATNRPPNGTSLAADLSHLGAVAAVAAMRASVKADVTVPVIDGAVHFPALGRLVIGRDGAAQGEGGEPEAASVVIADGMITIRAGGSQWEMAVPGLLAGRLRDRATSPAVFLRTGSRYACCGRLASVSRSKTPIRTGTVTSGPQHRA